MNITTITIYRFSIRMEPFTIATGTMNHAQNLLVRIATDTGMEGFGECSAFPAIVGETQDTCFVVAQAFARIWKGKDALDITERLAELDAYTAKNPTVKSAFDMALFDLVAKHAGLPLYRYLGGEARQVVSDITIGIGPLATMVATARRYATQGATAIKVKVGNDVNTDVAKIAAIRQAVGPKIAIRIDANQGWTFRQAIFALQAMEAIEVEFCEQPLHTSDDELLYALRQAVSIPIMADESCYSARDARKLARNRSCDYINIKLAKSGGIHEALKIHQVCQQERIACMIGGMLESRLAVTANLHLAYACSGIHFFDLDSALLGLLEDPVIGGATYDRYLMTLPDAAGIGASVDEQYLKGLEQVIV
ncbi:o-succinylbenzoate synthase/o-succinylbenzoate synthase,TIGR01928 [Parapedobacter luteus]|uniref:Dipeptide epimerase n=1 Tax=Parapedobacter luteus TaxID=623280 RepID=A0A1T5CV08_9SPHI|nr:dipeptide epimerase [Parapedobacter luteus]SKB63292.1 o-succinylbenzoate synthase/o-succinylbenzoate synthase,TIGR01928 [Parapedobacter luteus]